MKVEIISCEYDSTAKMEASMTLDNSTKLTDLLRQNEMPTYEQIQAWVKNKHGFVPKTCWIAHCKELNNLPLGRAPNRQGSSRVEPCPPGKRLAIEEAFRQFGMIPK